MRWHLQKPCLAIGYVWAAMPTPSARPITVGSLHASIPLSSLHLPLWPSCASDEEGMVLTRTREHVNGALRLHAARPRNACLAGCFAASIEW